MAEKNNVWSWTQNTMESASGTLGEQLRPLGTCQRLSSEPENPENPDEGHGEGNV